MTELVTNRWAGVEVVAWAGAGVGLVTGEPGLFLLAAVGVVFAAFAGAASPPEPDLYVRRELDDDAPTPGQEVIVRLVVEHRGDRPLLDVRLVDGVPAGHRVVEGTPAVGTVLRPGAARTVDYVVLAERGSHRFDPVSVVCRSLNGAYETALEEDVETTLACRPRLDGATDPVLRALVTHHGGRLPTDHGGSGTEFEGVRDHRREDPATRIDWARRARTGQLATLTFREERLATVACLVDARLPAYTYARDDEAGLHGVERGVRAAADLFGAVLDGGDRAGIAVVGHEPAWLAPGTGDLHRRRAASLLAEQPPIRPPVPRYWVRPGDPSVASSVVTSRVARQLRQLDVGLPTDAQVVFLSPLVDDAAVTIARRLQAGGRAVTAVSPDLTGGDSVGARFARLQRRQRLGVLRRADVRVLDWRPPTSLAVAVARARERWL